MHERVLEQEHPKSTIQKYIRNVLIIPEAGVQSPHIQQDL